MTEFQGSYDTVFGVYRDGGEVKLSLVRDSHGMYTQLPSDQAPAIAAVVLEAAGVELLDEDRRYLNEYGPQRYALKNAEVFARIALYYLKRCIQVREYHAKPRVSKEMVNAIRKGLTEGTHLTDWAIEVSAQAALDVGVLVPADNKEGDRG